MNNTKFAFSEYYSKQIELFGKNNIVELPRKILETFKPEEDFATLKDLDKMVS